MKDRVYIPHLQIRSKGVILYDLPEPPYNHKRHDFHKYETYTGTVTDHAAARIRRTVDVFLQKSPSRRIYNPVINAFHDFRLSFVTLTISAHNPIPTSDAHKALKVFIQHFRRPPSKGSHSEQMKSYLWKAELQERGQLHYHLTTNVFLHYAHIRRVWNGIQKNRGWLTDYFGKTGQWDANSTDVHAVYKVRDIQAYLSKYLSKSDRRDMSESGFQLPAYQRTIGGKVWDCSEDLKIPRYNQEFDGGNDDLLRQAQAEGKAEVQRLENCTYVRCDPKLILTPSDKINYENWAKS